MKMRIAVGLLFLFLLKCRREPRIRTPSLGRDRPLTPSLFSSSDNPYAQNFVKMKDPKPFQRSIQRPAHLWVEKALKNYSTFQNPFSFSINNYSLDSSRFYKMYWACSKEYIDSILLELDGNVLKYKNTFDLDSCLKKKDLNPSDAQAGSFQHDIFLSCENWPSFLPTSLSSLLFPNRLCGLGRQYFFFNFNFSISEKQGNDLLFINQKYLIGTPDGSPCILQSFSNGMYIPNCTVLQILEKGSQLNALETVEWTQFRFADAHFFSKPEYGWVSGSVFWKTDILEGLWTRTPDQQTLLTLLDDKRSKILTIDPTRNIHNIPLGNFEPIPISPVSVDCSFDGYQSVLNQSPPFLSREGLKVMWSDVNSNLILQGFLGRHSLWCLSSWVQDPLLIQDKKVYADPLSRLALVIVSAQPSSRFHPGIPAPSSRSNYAFRSQNIFGFVVDMQTGVIHTAQILSDLIKPDIPLTYVLENIQIENNQVSLIISYEVFSGETGLTRINERYTFQIPTLSLVGSNVL